MSLPPEPLGDDKEIRALAKILNTVPDLCASAGWTYSLAQLLNARGVRVSGVRAAPREPSPEALRAALDIWAPGADYDFTVVAAAIRAAYAVDGMGEPKVSETVWTIGLEVGPTVYIRVCGWEFMDDSRCGDLATHRTAGGLLLCATHLTDWARGIWRPCWVVLATGEVFGGVTHGCTVNCE